MSNPSPESPAAPRARRRWLVGLGVLLLVLLAAGAWTGVRAARAKSHLDAARTSLEVARQALLDRRVDDAQQAIGVAGAETAQGRAFADDPVVTAVAHLPLLGRSVAVVRGIALGVDDISREVLPAALEGVRTLDPGTLRRADGTIDLAVLATARPGVTTAATRMTAISSDVDDLPTSLVLGPVSGPQAEFADQVHELEASLRGASDALEIAPLMLGGDKPRHWFVLVQQTSESRGTGGLPGGFAVLEASKGKLTVTTRGSNAELPAGTVAPAGLPRDFVDRYGGDGAFDIWQNVNLSPDLPVVSQYVVQRWKAQTGQAVDGVIAMDAKALADLLKGSGPVTVGPGQSVPPEGIEDYLAVGQYAQNQDDQVGRKEQLTVVADAVIGRLTGGGGDSTALLRGLSTAVRSGHINVGTADPELAPALRRTGTDGALPRDDRSFAYPVVYNAAGSKLEYWLDRTVKYETLSCDGDRRRTRVTVTLTNSAPAVATLPTYVTIRIEDDGRRVQSTTDRLNLSVFATKGARLVDSTLDGKPVSDLQGGSEAGLPVWSTFLDLPAGPPRVLTLTLDEPKGSGDLSVLEQPLARGQSSSTDGDC